MGLPKMKVSTDMTTKIPKGKRKLSCVKDFGIPRKVNARGGKYLYLAGLFANCLSGKKAKKRSEGFVCVRVSVFASLSHGW